jgi:hypothetical protein
MPTAIVVCLSGTARAVHCCMSIVVLVALDARFVFGLGSHFVHSGDDSGARTEYKAVTFDVY